MLLSIVFSVADVLETSLVRGMRGVRFRLYQSCGNKGSVWVRGLDRGLEWWGGVISV